MNRKFKTVKERCEDCPALKLVVGTWFCDEADCPCDEVGTCDEYVGGAICEEYNRVYENNGGSKMKMNKDNFTLKIEEMISQLRRELGLETLKGVIKFSSGSNGFRFDYKIKDEKENKIIDISHSNTAKVSNQGDTIEKIKNMIKKMSVEQGHIDILDANCLLDYIDSLTRDIGLVQCDCCGAWVTEDKSVCINNDGVFCFNCRQDPTTAIDRAEYQSGD